MDRRLKAFYDTELSFLRQQGKEFAVEFPNVADRLGLQATPVSDPYVERLLEGVAFLSARVHLKMEERFPRFSESLLQIVYPTLLAPTPSMAIVRMDVDGREEALADGVRIPKDTRLIGERGDAADTPCEYRTGQDLTFWPLAISDVSYLSTMAVLRAEGWGGGKSAISAITVTLTRTGNGGMIGELPVAFLDLHLGGADAVPMALYEQMCSDLVEIRIRPVRGDGLRAADGGAGIAIPPSALEPLGFDTGQALLPGSPAGFDGYRLLAEFFAFPQKFLFYRLHLDGAQKAMMAESVEIAFILKRSDETLSAHLEDGHILLNCVPAINLFPKELDNVRLDPAAREYPVVPDRTKPYDYEVWSIQSVRGIGTGGAGGTASKTFQPLYGTPGAVRAGEQRYFLMHRSPRHLSEKQMREGVRSRYVGHQVTLTLTDTDHWKAMSGDGGAQFTLDGLRELSVRALCTNRDLPMHFPRGAGSTDFVVDADAPILSARIVSGPTIPQPSLASGAWCWSLISHLSLNYLSLLQEGDAVPLRGLLALYTPSDHNRANRMIDALKDVRVEPVVRRYPGSGPAAYVRGLQVRLVLEEASLEPVNIVLFGAVMEQFLRRYTSVNSFTQTVVESTERGVRNTWPARSGTRPTL